MIILAAVVAAALLGQVPQAPPPRKVQIKPQPAEPAISAPPEWKAGEWKPRTPPPHLKMSDEEYWEYVLPPGGIDAGTMLPPQPVYKWELTGVESIVDVPDIVMVDAIPVKMRHVVVKGRLEDVLRGVLISFQKQGLYIQDVEQQMKLSHHLQVTGLDPTRYISYSVLARPIDDKRVSLILGEANLGARAELKQKMGLDFAPVYPGGSEPLASVTEGFRTMAYEVQASEAEVKNYYSDVFKKAGYTRTDNGGADGAWTRGNEELRLVVRVVDRKSNVLLTRRSAGPPEPAPPK